jgi:Zn ribbon nucleic-acid-binding protein
MTKPFSGFARGMTTAVMTNSHSPQYPRLPLCCPKCGHEEAKLSMRSLSVVTVACVSCGHQWAEDVASLPDAARKQLDEASPD